MAFAQGFGPIVPGTGAKLPDPVTIGHGGTAPNPPDTTIADLHLFAGQSLGAGTGGDGALTTSAPSGTRCMQMNGGVRMIDYSGGVATVRAHASLTSLVEGTPDSTETGMASLCNTISLAQPGRLIIGASAAVSGTAIALRIKGTSIGDATRNIVTYAKALAIAQSGVSRMRVPYVYWIDTESDGFGGSSYYTKLVQEQIDLETDIKAITGQAEPVVFVLSQGPGTPQGTYDANQAQVDAAINFPTKFLLSAAKYPYEKYDGYHLTNRGYRQMGRALARAALGHAANGSYYGCQPISVTRSTKYVTLKLAAQTYPIRLASEDVLVPATGNYGFEWYDASGSPPTIVGVRFVDRDTLRIELSATPTGNSKLLQYAHTPDATQAAGPAITGRRGTIHDSTPDEPNYLNSFSIAAT